MIRVALALALVSLSACAPDYSAAVSPSQLALADSLLRSTSPVTLEDRPGPHPDTSEGHTCATTRAIASSVMSNRQSGVSLGDLLAKLGPHQGSSAGVIARSLATLAYQRPVYRVFDNRVRAINEFANDREARCYESLAAA